MSRIHKAGSTIRKQSTHVIPVVIALAAMLASGAAFAQFSQAQDSVCGFFDDINNLLSVASVAVVTIAVIFAGYQIAFAHKRISDVAPILVGGLLIGAAGYIASMLLPDNQQCTGGGGGMALQMRHLLAPYA